MKQLIKDRRTLDLIWRIIKDGVKIGAYPSQWFANTTLQPLDNLIRQSGLCTYYVRYMDNLTIFGSNKRKLRKLKILVEKWLNNKDLKLKHDWQIFPVNKRTPDAVGYRYGRGYTIPRKHNLIRMKRALGRYRKKRKKGYVPRKMAQSILSRLGQLKHCNNCNIYKKLYCGERIEKELKTIIKQNKEVMTWTMFLEQKKSERENAKFSRQSATATRTSVAMS